MTFTEREITLVIVAVEAEARQHATHARQMRHVVALYEKHDNAEGVATFTGYAEADEAKAAELRALLTKLTGG